MEQVIVNVLGMTCGGCANTIERSLVNLDGVESVKVQMAEGTVNVSFDSDVVNLEQIAKNIQESGYEVPQLPERTKSSCSCCKS